MKKIIYILGIVLLSNFCFAQDETAPIVPYGVETNFEAAPNEDSLINVDNMKRADQIKNAELEAAQNEQKRIKFDQSQVNRQRALNFTTKQNNALLPRF